MGDEVLREDRLGTMFWEGGSITKAAQRERERVTRDPSAVSSKTKHSKPPMKQAEHYHEDTSIWYRQLGTTRSLSTLTRLVASRNCEHVVAVNKDMSDNARPTYSTLVPNTPARDPKLPTPNAPTRSRTSANEVLYESLRAVCRRRGGGGKHRLPHPPSPEVS